MKIPIFCDIGITENCIFKCKMCKFWQFPKNNDELSVDEWKKFITSLEEFNTNKIRLHFAGGEPLVKEGVLDIISFASKKGFSTFIVTNGFLIDTAMATKMVNSGLEVITISLDSLDPDTHDSLRGVSGAYQHALQAITHLNKQGFGAVTILAIIMGPNLEQIIELAEWAQNNKGISSIYLQVVSQPIGTWPRDERWFEKDEFGYLWPKDLVRVESVIDQLINYKKKGYKITNCFKQLEMFKTYFKHPDKLRNGVNCDQGDYVIYVRPTGNVLLCGYKDPIGNIRADNIKNLWDSQEANLRRMQISSCQESCLNLLNCYVDKELP